MCLNKTQVKHKMQITIFCESWQMVCCGDPFAVGDTVDWCCRLPDPTERAMVDCDYWYEVHLDSELDIVGEVVEIYQLDFDNQTGENGLLSRVCQKTPVQSASRFASVGGFLVVLTNAKIEKDQ